MTDTRALKADIATAGDLDAPDRSLWRRLEPTILGISGVAILLLLWEVLPRIVTAWLAMEVLGRDYRFETRFYLDGDRVLYIRGGGDPFLISEELAQLASELVAAIGNEPLSGIVLDASYYPSDIRIPGIEDTDEAYDALNSDHSYHYLLRMSSLDAAADQPDAHDQTLTVDNAVSLTLSTDSLQVVGQLPQKARRMSIADDYNR